MYISAPKIFRKTSRTLLYELNIRVGWVKMTFSLLTEALESLEMFALLEDLVIHAEMLRYLEKGGNK